MKLRLLPKKFAICRLVSTASLPAWAIAGEHFSIVRTPEEFSIVCEEKFAPEEIQKEVGWQAFQVLESLDFSEVGLLASLSKTLADAKICLFAFSTYDTDYILVKVKSVSAATKALQKAGHTVEQLAKKSSVV
ncbi:MAG: ACT domain-containing protein [Verrucomicrobiota bacterium]|nr:ACT domain-containing protein [Verrucomicrobiota bacterium]